MRTVKKTLLFLLLVVTCLMLTICGSRHLHEYALAQKMLRDLEKIPLPLDAEVVNQGWDVGGFISGTGSAVDLVVYRIFTTDQSEPDVRAFIEHQISDRARGDGQFGFFRLDTSEGKRVNSTEGSLRSMLKVPATPAYVIYSIDRIGDGTFDIRGW